MKRECLTRRMFADVSGQWGGIVLAALRERPYRFAELRRAVDGISEKMLSQTLRALERDGLVDRLARPVVPPHVEYRLTPAGIECAERVVALSEWVETHVREIYRSQCAYDQEREMERSASVTGLGAAYGG
jgi:DNA-binding HxlR family transcriptional regulator